MRVEEPLVLISCDERPAKRVRGSSVVRAETPAPAEVGYALSSGRHADLIDRSGVQSNLLSLILTQNMAKHSLKRRISPRFLEDRRRASVRSVPARKIGKINFELRQWRQLERSGRRWDEKRVYTSRALTRPTRDIGHLCLNASR